MKVFGLESGEPGSTPPPRIPRSTSQVFKIPFRFRLRFKLKIIFTFSDLYWVSLEFQDQMAYRECRASRGHTDPREGKVQRDKLGIKDRKESRVQEETEGAKDLLGRMDPAEFRECKVNRDFWE